MNAFAAIARTEQSATSPKGPARYDPPDLLHAVALGRMFGHAPLRLDAANTPLTLRIVPAADTGPQPGTVCLRWVFGDACGTLDLPAAVVARLVASIEPAPLAPLDPPTTCLLLELALTAQIEALEGRTARSLSLAPATPHDREPLAADLRGAFGAEPVEARLTMSAEALSLLTGLLGTLGWEDADVANIPVAQAVRVGTARLGAALLATAVPGDALLLRGAPGGCDAVVVAGERYAAPARLNGRQLQLQTSLRPASDAGLEEWTMPQDTVLTTPADDVGPADIPMDDLQVTLVFELSRRAATLAELRRLAAGQVLELDCDLSAPVSILANGRRIGEGELVKVGGALAVRIHRLHARG